MGSHCSMAETSMKIESLRFMVQVNGENPASTKSTHKIQT